MSESSRTSNSLKNVFAAWGGQAIYAIGSFTVRAVLISQLAQVFVGLESLFSSILTILSLADLGFGSAIVFALYEPLAKGDKESVKSLMRLFKRVYISIGVVIIALGACLTPNIQALLGPDCPDIPLIQTYFFCFVLNTGVSYFFSYRGSLLMADQKSYVVYIITYSCQILMCVAQIAVLLITQEYLYFLICMVSSTLVQNIVIAYVSGKRYPYLKEKDIAPINKQVLHDVKQNIVGLFMHKVAGACSTPASNLIITNVVGIGVTSLYGNYLMIVNALTQVLSKMFDSIVASVGNLGVTESKERQNEVFRTTFFINGMLYMIISCGFVCAVDPFIDVLAGPDWRLEPVTVFLVVFLFYVKGMRDAGQSFTSAYGLFWKTKWKAVLEAVFLPTFALVLAFPFGLNGVLAGCALSSLGISTIYEGWAVYRFGLERPLREYLILFTKYLLLTTVTMAVLLFVCELVPLGGLLGFFVKGAFGVAVSTALWMLLYRKTREWEECRGIFDHVVAKLRKKA